MSDLFVEKSEQVPHEQAFHEQPSQERDEMATHEMRTHNHLDRTIGFIFNSIQCPQENTTDFIPDSYN